MGAWSVSITGSNTRTGYQRREARLVGCMDVTLTEHEQFNETMILPSLLPPEYETDAEIACMIFGNK